jgi:NhaP-type Na+/H+ or K+/H+ antiporter
MLSATACAAQVSALFKLLSTLAEVFVFVYIGASLVNAKLNAPHIPAFLVSSGGTHALSPGCGLAALPTGLV